MVKTAAECQLFCKCNQMGKNKKANTRFPLIVASVLAYNWVRKQKTKTKTKCSIASSNTFEYAMKVQCRVEMSLKCSRT